MNNLPTEYHKATIAQKQGKA